MHWMEGCLCVAVAKVWGEGVEQALVEVAMAKGGLNEEEAKGFWEGKKEGGQYIAETW